MWSGGCPRPPSDMGTGAIGGPLSERSTWFHPEAFRPVMTDTPLYAIFVREGKSKTCYKVGYINPVGRTVIDPIYNNGTRFHEGLAAVCVHEGRWGIIDTRGNFHR